MMLNVELPSSNKSYSDVVIRSAAAALGFLTVRSYMSVFAHQVGGDPFQVHELFLSLAAIGGFGFSMLVLLKVQVREWFKKFFRSRR